MKKLPNKLLSPKDTVIDDYVDDDGILLMTNVHQDDTGLPIIVWASMKMSGSGPRIKVQNNYLKKPTYNFFSVSIEENPKAVSKKKIKITNQDLRAVFDWVILNKKCLMDVWNGKISSMDFVRAMKKVKIRDLLKFPDELPNDRREITEDDMFILCEVQQKRTGLSSVIYMFPNFFHDNDHNIPRIKVHNNYSSTDSIQDNNLFTVTVEDEPKVTGNVGILTRKDINEIVEFVNVNKEVLQEHWHEDDDVHTVKLLKKVGNNPGDDIFDILDFVDNMKKATPGKD